LDAFRAEELSLTVDVAADASVFERPAISKIAINRREAPTLPATMTRRPFHDFAGARDSGEIAF